MSSLPARRRLSPDDRRSELLTLGAEVFGQRPYDEVRIDEIAERAGVSRALMYHYFPDKRAFFAAVVRAESERLFEATSTPANDGQSLFDRLRAGVLAYMLVSALMRLVVDLNKCQGYAQCVPLAPEVLELVGEEALAYDPNPDDSQRQQVLRAAASCPVQAIIVEIDPPADRDTP